MKKLIYVVFLVVALIMLADGVLMLGFPNSPRSWSSATAWVVLTGLQLDTTWLIAIFLIGGLILLMVFGSLLVSEFIKKSEADFDAKMRNEASKFAGKTWRVARATSGKDNGELHMIVLLASHSSQPEIMLVVEGHEHFKTFAFLEDGDRVTFASSQSNQAEDWVIFPSSFLIPTVIGNDHSGD